MIIKANKEGAFELAPEGQYDVVCVDVTPPKTYKTQYGEKKKFFFVFELPASAGLRKEGGRFAVWSRPLVPSLYDRASLRKFLKQWRGFDLTAVEMSAGFDVESMLGVSASVIIRHEKFVGKDGQEKTFANIDYICKSKVQVEPSGEFVRMKDRPSKDEGGNEPF